MTVEEPPPNVDEPDTTELDLYTWGLSGQPAEWALSTWTYVIETIRSANRGFADGAAVQAAIDQTFPGKGYLAANVMLAHPPTGEFSVEVVGDRTVHIVTPPDEDLGLPADNIQWDWGDGTTEYDAGCPEHQYAEFGTYGIELVISVAGARYGSGVWVAIGDEAQPVDNGTAYDPGEHTVVEVNAYLDEHPDELHAVWDAEKAGKARTGILG